MIPAIFGELHEKIEIQFKEFVLPKTNSIAENELADTTDHDNETIKSVHGYVMQLIEVTSDNITAFTRDITSPVLLFAFYTNIRVILEVAATSLWFLEEHITHNERINRYCAWRYYSLKQQLLWANATKNQELIKHSQDRFNDAQNKAKAKGITKQRKGKDEPPMPGLTQMVRDQLHEEETYRLLSALIHAHSWALMVYGFDVVSKSPYGKQLEKTLKPEFIYSTALVGLDAFSKQILCVCKYFGWPFSKIEALFNDTKKSLQQLAKNSLY